MRAHYFQHVPFEGLGNIETWLEAAGWEITGTRFFTAAELPDPKNIDLLVVMGGPMSVNDEEDFPWLVEEKRFIRAAIESGKPVLGICLGAQLIASALGARVYRNSVKEIGWFPIEGVAETGASSLKFPAATTVFHWHGETFDLPSGATLLARSAGCENQAFQFGESVIALQFHVESTPESVREIVGNCREELVPGRYIQGEDEILSAGPERYQMIHRLLDDIMRHCVAQRRRMPIHTQPGDVCRNQG